MTPRLALGLSLASAVVCARPARAQTGHWNPYSTSVYREGPGVRAGSAPLVFHPGFILEGGYDSNVFYLPGSSSPVGSGLLRLRAHLDLATLPRQRMEGDTGTADQKLEFRFSTQVEYREYLSANDNVRAQRSVNVYALADLTILPKGPFTLKLFDTFIRTVDPRNLEGPSNQSRDYNRVGFRATGRPGTGRLELGLADHFDVHYWEAPDLQMGNLLANEAQLFARFRFLPETWGGLTARVGYTRYSNQPSLEAVPLRVVADLTTPVTRWFGLGAALGYGNSFHLRARGFQHVLARLEARFSLPARTRIALGYDRDFFESLLATYYVDDLLYLTFDLPVVRRIEARLAGGLRFRHYGELVSPAVFGQVGYSTPDRQDMIYDLRAELGVRATSWLGLAVSYNFVANTTAFATLAASSADPSGTRALPGDYLKHSAFARVDFAY